VARDRYSDKEDGRRSSRDRSSRDRRYDESEYLDAVDDSAEYDAYDSAYADSYDDGTGEIRALALQSDDQQLAPYDEESRHVPVVIPGTGVSMGAPFIKRRERPLTMRLAVLVMVATLLVTGMISVTPIGAAAQPGVSSFEALAGAVVLTKSQQFIWYTAQWGDSVDSIAKKFTVEVGGIMQLNKLCPGQELQIGKQYKIPTNPTYGAGYQQEIQASGACNLLPVGGAWGATVFGSNWWNARAGNPGPEAVCSPVHGNAVTGGQSEDLKYQFISPDWNSGWVRGYSWYHDGVDIAAPSGNKIHAVQAGQIIWAGYDGTNGFGWSVVINHCYNVSTLYGHMNGLAPGISIGQNVDQGQVIGYEGSTGWSTGPHLHISIMINNQMVNPMLFYQDIYHITHFVAPS
jgi:murein DD-endopeptidase MepM/ murein hydrolase activator NlpD